MITKDELRHLGWLSRIELSDSELETYPGQIEQIIRYLDTLDSVKFEQKDAVSKNPSGKKDFSELRADKQEDFGPGAIGTRYRKDGYVIGPRMS